MCLLGWGVVVVYTFCLYVLYIQSAGYGFAEAIWLLLVVFLFCVRMVSGEGGAVDTFCRYKM